MVVMLGVMVEMRHLHLRLVVVEEVVVALQPELVELVEHMVIMGQAEELVVLLVIEGVEEEEVLEALGYRVLLVLVGMAEMD